MRQNRTNLACVVFAAWAAIVGGCAAGDGGQSGTGISALRGNVVAVNGSTLGVAGIRVSLPATGLTTRTDADGVFELRGATSGQVELRFERQTDGLFASTEVVIPAGGLLELRQIVLDSGNGEVRPERQEVQFEGAVKTLDCTGGTIVIVAREDEAGTVFTVEVASAIIHRGTTPLTCSDLRVGDSVEVIAEATDGSTLINADLSLEDGEEEPGDRNVELEGFVATLDCAGGVILVTPTESQAAPVFTVEVASATIRRGELLLGCDDLHAGDRIQVQAQTTDGSTLVNAVIEVEDGGGGPDDNPDDQNVELEGFVAGLDCAGGAILVTPREAQTVAVFAIETASATVRRGDLMLACSDLRVGDRIQVVAQTADGSTLVNAVIEVEDTAEGD
jgi:hypothetical protein